MLYITLHEEEAEMLLATLVDTIRAGEEAISEYAEDLDYTEIADAVRKVDTFTDIFNIIKDAAKNAEEDTWFPCLEVEPWKLGNYIETILRYSPVISTGDEDYDRFRMAEHIARELSDRFVLLYQPEEDDTSAPDNEE